MFAFYPHLNEGHWSCILHSISVSELIGCCKEEKEMWLSQKPVGTRESVAQR